MVNELIPPEIIPIIWFAGISVTEETGNQIDNLINNAPRILDEVNKEIAAQREQGVTDQQMSGLLQKKQLLELGTSIPPEVYNIVAKPLVRKLIGFVGKI